MRNWLSNEDPPWIGQREFVKPLTGRGLTPAARTKKVRTFFRKLIRVR
jgi:hypothetical protein